jgi:MATE family multidrug resistance protein
MRTHFHFVREEIRPMLRLAWPLVLAELGWSFMGIVDTMMVGRLPDSAVAIGATSLGNALGIAVGLFGGGLLFGLDTLVSQSFGARRISDCHHSLLNAIYLALAITLPVMGLLWASGDLLAWLRVDAAVLQLALPYINAITWSMLPLMLYFAARRYLQAMDLVRPVAFALVTANLVNVFGNWVLIYGKLGFPAMGVEGSGWSTCIARSYMAAVLLVYIVHHDRRYGTGLWAAARRPDGQRIRELLRLGVPVSVMLTLEIGVFSAATTLAGKLGAIPLASHQVALHCASFAFMVPLGISAAAAVRVGQGIGRRDPQGATRAGWTAILFGTVFMSCSALIFLLAPRLLARVFTPDPTVIAASATLLAIAALFQLADGIQVVAIGALRGAGDTRTPMLTHLVSFWVVGLPLGYWLCFTRNWGAAGLWAGLCIGLILTGSVLLLAWRRRTRHFVQYGPVAMELGTRPAE